MLVKDVMTKNPVTVQSDVSVLEAKELFTKNKISKLPVLNKNGELVGIITKNDLNRASPSDASTLDVYEMGYLLSKITVEKTMCKSVKTTTEDIPVEEAARLMADYGIGCLPVVSGKLVVGIVTSSDLFHCFVEMFSTVPARPSKGGIVDMKYDFSATNQILPHPVYAWMGWICILNPSEQTFTKIKPLIQEAYEYAKEKFKKGKA